MALSIEQLTTPVTEAEALEDHLDILESLNFPARSWQSGSTPRTLVQLSARLRANASTLITSIAAGGFNELATGGWLTLLSLSHYQNVRLVEVRTRGDVYLECASGSGPYTKAVGTVVVKDASTGQAYRNVDGFTLSSSAAVTVLFEAEEAGEAGNVGDGDIDTLVTSMAGVTVNGTPVTDWIDVTGGVSGADEETDPELRTRNRNKWATLGIGGPKQAYKTWALEALSTVTRVGVDDTNAAGTGVVGVYLADSTGGTPDTGNAVRDYLLGTDGVGRHPLGPAPTVAAATEAPVTVTYAATYDSAVYASDAAAVAAVDAAIIAYFASVPVGGVSESGGTVLPLGSLYAAAIATTGIVNVVFTSPTASTALTVSQVATISGGTPSGSATAAT